MSLELTLIWAFIAHLFGDYVIQTHHQAVEKTKRWLPAILHGVTYTLPFVLLTQSIPALLIICVTHIIIDHYRLARHLVWAKNHLAPRAFWPSKEDLHTTGSPSSAPVWLSTWVMIIADNATHLAINALSIIFLGSVLPLPFTFPWS